jgi:hypothetical protein
MTLTFGVFLAPAPVTFGCIGPDEATLLLDAGCEPPALVALVGPRGARGADGSAFVEAQAGENIAAGQAFRIDALGHAVLAQADAYNHSNAVALASAPALTGFICAGSRDRVTLSDWTAITGTALLVPGADYFLSATLAGGLTSTPPESGGQVVLFIGTALSTVTLLISIDEPCLL